MAQEITLEEIFADLRKEIQEGPQNPPFSFTTKMFAAKVGVSKTKANTLLSQYEKEGRVRKLNKYYRKNKNGQPHAVSGWQWIIDDDNKETDTD